MVAIRNDIVNYGHGFLAPHLFAIHSTANPGATARNHRDLWSRGYDYAVHLVSDWTEAYQCVPFDRLCYQVGGNGTGKLRYRQLTDDYKRRLSDDDWNY